MSNKSSGSLIHQKAIIILFYASLLILILAAILNAASSSFLRLPFSPGLVIQLRTIGTVLFILYYLLILPVTEPKKIFVPAVCVIAVTWLASKVAATICDMIPAGMVLGFIGGMFLLSIFGIFIIFVIPYIESFLTGIFSAFLGINALLVTACLYLPSVANDSISTSIRKKYKDYGFLLALILLVTSAFWYSPIWCNGYYKEGLKAEANGDYNRADTMFRQVGSYKDARDRENTMFYAAEKQAVSDARSAGDEAMAAGDYAKALDFYESQNLTFCSAKARAYLALQSGNLISAADDLKYLFEHDCYDLKDETLELYRTHPELFTKGDTYYMGSESNSSGEMTVNEWLIVGEDEESFSLLSKELLPARPVSEESVETFADSDLYYYLNHDYLDSVFSAEEKAIMYKPVDYYLNHPQEYQWPILIPNEREIEIYRSVEGFDSLLGKNQWLFDIHEGDVMVGRGKVNSVLLEDGRFDVCPQYNNRFVRPLVRIYK